jgi:hypothetical protein
VRRGTPGAQPSYPGSPPEHIHDGQTETFSVLKGTMGYRVDGVLGAISVGESVTVPPGAAHFFYNAADESSDLLVRITLRPALTARAFFSNLAGVARDYGHVGAAPPLQLIALFNAGGAALALPAPARAAITHVGGALAAMHGYASAYEAYATGVTGGNK